MKQDKIKIAFICIYSKGGCGVWARVRQFSEVLDKKNYEVSVLSTNNIKGSDLKADSFENYKGINIYRFPCFLEFGRNLKFWSFSKKLKQINPDIIVAEVYRHPHTLFALNSAKKLKKPVFLTTHAPFVEKSRRSKTGKVLEAFYDKFIGTKILNKFNEIIAITKWEIPFLKKIGVKKKLNFIPNGIPQEFFNNKIILRQPQKILYFGRISPVKNLETLIKAISLINNNNINVKLIGDAEKEYKIKLDNLIKEKKLNNIIKFSPGVFDIKKKIKIMNESDIFVLPSKREAMPQTLIELMSLGKIVIASDTKGAKEIVVDGKNGFLFKINDEEELKKKILFCLDKKNHSKIKKIQINARKSVEKYNLDKVVAKFEKLIKKYKK